MRKTILFFVILVAVLIFVPCICNATNITTATNEDTLKSAIANANANDTIILQGNIEVNGNISVNKTITIDGQGKYSIKGSDTWYNNGGSGDQAIITSTAGTLTLKDITVKHGPKQCVQAYGAGALVLDGVIVGESKGYYSAVIAHGGTITIKDLKIEDCKVGIEVGQKSSVSQTPKIVMDGTIEVNSDAFIYMDPETSSDLKVENTENTVNEIHPHGDKVVITNNEGEVVYESTALPLTEGETIKEVATSGSEETEVKTIFYTVTVKYAGKTKTIVVKEGETLASVDLSDVKNAVKGKVFVEFLKNDGTEYNEKAKITADLSLVAVYEDEVVQPSNTTPSTTNKGDKDDSPKTGVENTVVFVLASIAIASLAGIAIIRKK